MYILTIYELKLNNDNTASYIIGTSNNDKYTDITEIMNYSGTYLEKNNKIILSIISTDSNCEDGKYACKDIITLNKDENKLIDNETSSIVYEKTEDILLINK